MEVNQELEFRWRLRNLEKDLHGKNLPEQSRIYTKFKEVNASTLTKNISFIEALDKILRDAQDARLDELRLHRQKSNDCSERQDDLQFELEL